jgi:hypothetical protein
MRSPATVNHWSFGDQFLKRRIVMREGGYGWFFAKSDGKMGEKPQVTGDKLSFIGADCHKVASAND